MSQKPVIAVEDITNVMLQERRPRFTAFSGSFRILCWEAG